MLNILLSFVIKCLSLIASIIFSPFTIALNLLIPNFSIYFSRILQFFTSASAYFSFFCKLFMIPSGLIIAVLSLSTALITFNIAVSSVFFIINLYKTLKP